MEKVGGNNKNIAHVIAVNMGYGHARPANVMKEFAVGGKVIIANNYKGIPESDRKLWDTGQSFYEKISRFKKTPVVGQGVFWAMDELQRIPEFYPKRDLSHPSLQLRNIYNLIHNKDHMKHLIEKLAKNPKPIFSTFSPPAFAAEYFDYPGEIFCLATDADINRAWAPLRPRSSRVRYFAPNGRVVERLQLYGVPKKNIELTGFPLPTSLIGGVSSSIATKNLARRICNLDPNGIFTSHTYKTLVSELGVRYCESIRTQQAKILNIAFAVGGAGAQREMGIEIASSLKKLIRSKKIILHLVAGVRKEVADYFISELKKLGLESEMGKGVKILIEDTRPKYFAKFDQLMQRIDILWTKPSELSFYTGLGLPIIMAPPVGSQEDFNHHWLEQVGGGIDALDPKYTNEWLMDWVESGSLARMAWNGFIEAPTHGAYRIADVLLGRSNTVHDLPLVV